MLKRLTAAFLGVVKLQLCDFLPPEHGQGGKYFAVQDENLRQRLESSKLTNIVGEQCFGDLDFSVFKRRHASSHHHSTVNLMQRNKTISNWFITLPEGDQTTMLRQAASKAASLRNKHQEEELRAVQLRQQLLQETLEKKTAAENKRRRRIDDVMGRLRTHHGPCRSAADVDHLLQTYHTLKRKEDALKAEILYHKLVLKETSPLLRVTAKLPALSRNLRRFLGQEADHQEGAYEEMEPEQGGAHENMESDHEQGGTQEDMEVDTDDELDGVGEQEQEQEMMREVAEFDFSREHPSRVTSSCWI